MAALAHFAVKTAQRIPWRFVPPNAVTLLALGLGIVALVAAGDNKFEEAAIAVLAAALLDACDGKVARAMGGASRFGTELDSLADLVSFGVAPAFILERAFLKDAGVSGLLACAVFPMATALRLARFNVESGQPQPTWKRSYFKGVPAPAGAFLVLVPLFALKAGWVQPDSAPAIVALWAFAVAGLMVSALPTFSAKKIGLRQARRSALPSSAGLVCLFFWPWSVLCLAAALYLLSMPLSWRLARRARLEA
jgi:CDP-diacylglycerol--serine O-phosphatidyltransferase